MKKKILVYPLLALGLLGAGYETGRIRKAQVGLEQVKLRSEPEGPQTGTLEPGTELEVLETQGDWVKVRAVGWVYRPALKNLGTPVPSRSPRPTETTFAPSHGPIKPIEPIAPDWTPTPGK